MKKEGYLTISEFSEIAEVSRKTLIFYDNIGLFSPEYTAENGYRYYSHEQIYIIFVINILKEIGMPLKRIGAFLRQRTPAEAVSLLRQQAGVIDQKIRSLQSFRDMLDIKAERLAEAAETDDSERESEKSAVRLVAQQERFLFLSAPEDVRKTEVPDAVWLRFYMKCKAHGIAMGYPEGFLVKREDFLSAGQKELPISSFMWGIRSMPTASCRRALILPSAAEEVRRYRTAVPPIRGIYRRESA